jgi:hypothetical protein
MTNRLQDIASLVDQLDQAMLKARLAHFVGGTLDEEAMLRLSADAIDTADVVEEYAIAGSDAAAAVGSIDRPPATILAGQLRTDLSRDLKDSSVADDEGANMLREVGAGLAQVVKSRRAARIKGADDRKMDELNRNLLRRLKEETAPTPVERFWEQYVAHRPGRRPSKTASCSGRTSQNAKRSGAVSS